MDSLRQKTETFHPPSNAHPVSSQSVPLGLSISTAFTPSELVDGAAPDLLIVTSDAVHFHVHTRSILALSTNAFNRALASPVNTLVVMETAAVMNVVLNVLYGWSCIVYEPEFEDVVVALAALVKYGASLPTLAVAPLPLFDLLLAQAPLHAIDIYASAGQYELEDVAVAVSAHLLAFSPSQLTDELALQMGPVYFKRILDLQQNRLLALKGIVLDPPAKHPPTLTCNIASRDELTTSWALATAQLVWDACPSISTDALQSAFERTCTGISCPDCRIKLQSRVQEVTRAWSAVKRTI
ncbi:hypothetical protein L227DRAFT_179400 [Lentinus tigrinus ALCF2SS1-6]|uniref:BTB domain-containing protein n=1 Tax=Lentinus tigrinus ALCF2SS1-6 TaxID=1328759 RepID=A0A5C2SC24_9APHY|nr:hypothetical protein L227DRAFT_179400 [Lentinus tigrinus ALCF2SS1-6]